MDTLPVEYNGLTYIDLAQAIPLMEVAAEESEDLGLGAMDEIPDASESCANYATQEEAQAAYDAAESETFDLDQDFDGEVCEDYFASDDAASETDEDQRQTRRVTTPADALADVDYSAIKAFAFVYVRRWRSAAFVVDPLHLRVGCRFRGRRSTMREGQGARVRRAPWLRLSANWSN